MDKKPPVVIKIDPQRLATVLGIATAVSAGESSPLFLEERVRELQEYVPFLPMAISWMARAMDNRAEAKEKDIENDPVALQEFMKHQDMMNQAGGALAALLCVGESLRSESQAAESASKKGKRNVRK